MNAARLVLPLTAVACYGHPVPPPPPVPAGPAFTCRTGRTRDGPVRSADCAQPRVALVSGDAPDWSAPRPAPSRPARPRPLGRASAPAATPTSVWGASAPDAPDSAPSPWGAPAPAGPDSAPGPWGRLRRSPPNLPAPAGLGGSPAIAAAPAAPVAPTWGAAADEPARSRPYPTRAVRTQAEVWSFGQADGAPSEA